MPFEITAGADSVKPGRYRAALTKVEIGQSTFGDFRSWHFLVDVEGVATEVTGVTSLNTGPQSKAYAWLKALLRRDLKAGEKLEDPVGQNVTVVVELNKKGFATITDLEPLAEPAQVEAGIPR